MSNLPMSNAFVRQRFWQCGKYGYPDVHRGENSRPRCRATDRRRTVLVSQPVLVHPGRELDRRGQYRLDRAADVVWAAPGAALMEAHSRSLAGRHMQTGDDVEADVRHPCADVRSARTP